ncbi:MAG: hypothetical protein V4592_13775 [Bacteroidota bacterium]
MKLKTGKEEIVYLLAAVFKKYEQTTGHELVRNTNRKNYEDLARILSKISNELPNTAETLGHDQYAPDRYNKNLEYPYLKYDITGGQIKDAANGIVSNPRPFLVDACYIYLYGMGRRAFETVPSDPELIDHSNDGTAAIATSPIKTFNTESKLWRWASPVFVIIILFCAFSWYQTASKLKTLENDLKITPYQPTATDIAALEGLWTVYIGSPQARVSDSNRYHMAVRNIVDVHYKDGYFVFNRYGASFDHLGYMQFENPNVVSIHSYLKNNTDSVESPRLSLMRFDHDRKRLIVISASWNFDVGNRNDIIGIREVYIRQGNSGPVEEVINTVENSSCRCKIIRWHHGKQSINFYLRNENIDSLADASLKELLDEHSILLRQPTKGILLSSGKK